MNIHELIEERNIKKSKNYHYKIESRNDFEFRAKFQPCRMSIFKKIKRISEFLILLSKNCPKLKVTILPCDDDFSILIISVYKKTKTKNLRTLVTCVIKKKIIYTCDANGVNWLNEITSGSISIIETSIVNVEKRKSHVLSQ